MNKNILHITDLHLDDPNSINEKLRDGFYVDYILTLVEKIKNEIGEIHLILCTGDIINKAKVSNFEQAEKIFNFLLEQLGLDNGKLCFCPGNHDIVVNDKLISLDDYNDFVLKTSSAKPITENPFFSLYEFELLDLNVLSFNSVINSNNSINKISTDSNSAAPNTLNDPEIDKIVSIIHNSLINNRDLIIMSHFPPMISSRYRPILEEVGWIDKHLWKTGNILSSRILTRRKTSRTLWLSGDSHMPDFFSLNSYAHFSMTGMVGGNYTNPTFSDGTPFNKSNEVKVICFKDEKPEPEYCTFIYKPTGFNFSPQDGEWTLNKSGARIIKDEVSSATQTVVDNPPTTQSNQDEKTKIISTSVESDIIETITDNKLYMFDRFATDANKSSLGWIRIFELFKKTELLSRCIDKSVEWIKGLIHFNMTSENTLLIGIDYWGSIFASQVSIRLSIKNYCVSARSFGKHIHLHESCDFLCLKLKQFPNIKNFILFTDVISTGNTVLTIKSKILDTLLNPDVSFFAISIISDKIHPKNKDINSFVEVGTFCRMLPIPILNNEQLPSELILPPRYDIR